MTVIRERHGRVELVTINRPDKANALDPATIRGIGQAMLDVEADDGLAVLVIAGAGDRFFCAGMDLAGFAAGTASAPSEASERYERFYTEGLAKPVIAAVNGMAVGGGFELALACDLVVAGDHARFGLPEVKRGLFAGAGGTLLPTRVPMAKALELLLLGDLVDVGFIDRLGLVNRVVPGPEVVPTALELATRLAANAPLALAASKRLAYDALESPVSVAWQNVLRERAEILLTDDAKEGARAFVDKRTPRWTGR
jgi:enoyl-CoA hydratase